MYEEALKEGNVNNINDLLAIKMVVKDLSDCYLTLGVVNKIGSLMVALAAKHFHVPFYVAAPLSTFDMDASVFDTEIEERDGDEVRYYGGCRICPKGTEVINPAFDIVPKELITGIITENGIIDPI